MTRHASVERPRAHALLEDALSTDVARLDLAALAVAYLEYPDLSLGPSLERLDALAARVRARAASPLMLARVLGEEEGFGGDPERYHQPENSFLNRVLERRVGLPITLSVVYLEVARRAEIPLYGVALPGHFIVASGFGAGRLLLDPFDGGEPLTEEGCKDLLGRVAPQVKFHSKLLDPTPPAAIAYRMLSNLKKAYLEAADGERALRAVNMMLQLAPDHPGELRARASLLSGLGAYRAALADVVRCLEISPEAPDHRSLVITARALQERVDLLN
ncbi:MAG TPA: tetratricopeptide repeat protein [Myxococcaceae bacterium]|nr:tetratricopeptide repeat protein [Myxococcaceae bacterium]